jgi:hypothetical protein
LKINNKVLNENSLEIFISFFLTTKIEKKKGKYLRKIRIINLTIKDYLLNIDQ